MPVSPAPAPAPTEPAPPAGSEADLKRRLDLSRRELLDLTARNRLLHTPRRQARSSSIEIVGGSPEHVHRLLVIEGKAMSFEAASEAQTTVKPAMSTSPLAEAALEPDQPAFSDVDGSPEAPAVLPQPEEAEQRRRDDRLQTLLASNQLQQRLLRTFHAAHTFEEEQGVNVLFLALGFLKWHEEDKPGKERFAPLLLVPVELERQSVASRFRVHWSGEDITTNLSLQVKLRSEYRVDLPEVDASLDADEEIAPAKYFELVRQSIAGMKDWEVLDKDIVLGFFSFAKLLMYRDLDPGAWPESRALHQHALMNGLLGGALPPGIKGDDAPLCGEDALIDPLIEPRDMMHVVDADSSQAIVVEEAKRGRNLVIQGPPGTGKSQTISNIIAAAVMSGKRVLFVAEKVAALNVVKDRLGNIGLGDMCLALHSNKARKAAVLADIGRTLALDKPVVRDAEQIAAQLKDARDRLNEHALAMHTPLPPSDVTAWQCVGELARLRAGGVPTSDLTLEGCQSLTAQQTAQRRTMLKELAAFAAEIGVPAKHPWRGVMLASMLPMDLDRIKPRFEPAAQAVRAASAAAADLARSLHQSIDANAVTFAWARSLARAAERIAGAPQMDRTAIADGVWESNRAELVQIIAAGAKISETRSRLASTLIESAWTTDFSAVRRDIAAHGEGLFRFLSSAYRRAKNTLRGVLAAGAPLPRSNAERLALMDAVIAAQAAQKSMAASSELGRRAFGQLWLGEKSNWQALAAVERWESECRSDVQMPRDFRQIASRTTDARPLTEAARNVQAACDRAQAAASEIFTALQIDVSAAFSAPAPSATAGAGQPIDYVGLADLATRLDLWRSNPEGITKWIAYRQRDEQCRAAGMGEVCERLRDGRMTPPQALDRFDAAYFERILRQLATVHPSLSTFDGLAHERLLQQFRDLDQQRISLARAEVALAHWEKVPRGASVIGEVGVIRRELAKKRRHLPIRQLLKAAGNAVQAVKPVFMMSPLSIAQYIEPGALEFDILLIDEASQVRPVDALGAIARAKQIIVVGDDKQLPPTRFFTREFEGDVEDEPDAEASATGDLESILGLCGSLDLPQRMLRWHYRSRHHSLITVSNREFYDNRLYVVPSPMERDATRGLVFHHVRDGVFDRGASATNRVEAKVLAQAVMKHARDWPKLSLGVGAFSVQQRDAIIDEIESLRRADPGVESFFATDVAEPFFVKNLENIQGDERDVIFISVGYARDAKGSLTMNFGPLSNAGGERRLNVLITRAKTRCEVFTSITADDIDLNRATGKGPAAFKAFLAYAQRGVLEGIGAAAGAEALQQVLAKSLRDAGWQADLNVGVAGFFVDLAARKPDAPVGEYALGIEYDGPDYSASRSARDRDRTQPFVLSDRGWRLHRIWSMDFLNRPDEQIRRTLEALMSAQSEQGVSKPTPTSVPAAAFSREESSRARTAKDDEGAIAIPYKEARFRVPASREIPELPMGKLAEIIANIVEIEGPIHGDEITERLRHLWDAGRVGARMVRAIDTALEWAVRTRLIWRDGEFYLRSPDSPVAVRDRSEVESSSLRDPAMLPPAEIRVCVQRMVRANFGVTREEMITAAARTLGFKATTPGLRETIDSQVTHMLESTTLIEDNGRLREKA